MARNAMQTARQGAEIAGHNLANASAPNYARQRVKIQAAVSIPTDKGPQGSGADVARIEQIRDYAIDKTIQTEKSVTSYLETKQRHLRRGETALGQTLDRHTIDAGEVYGNQGISEGLAGLFASFQSLAANPTSIGERQTVVFNAQKLADKLNAVDRRLSDLRQSINDEVKDEVANVNAKIQEVAYLAASIGNTEIVEGSANEIRDAMQAALEELAQYGNVFTSTNEDGELHVFMDDVQMVTGNVMTNTVKLHTDAEGMHFLADAGTGNIMNLKSGTIRALTDVRDSSIKELRSDLDTLASNLITEINALHQTGFDLDGNNDPSLTFFSGSGAEDIGVNTTLISDPRKLQASGSATEEGDNDVIRKMAALSEGAVTGLDNMTFTVHYGNTLSRFGQEIALNDVQLEDQQAVQNMLLRQRDSVQGVSIDEEVANLIIFQRAFQASAKLITTMDTLMADVINLQR